MIQHGRAGPVEGGSIVRVPLEGLAWLREDGFTWHDGANNSKRVHLGMQASCRFGVAVVPATVAYESEDSDDGDVEHLECISPNATAAGVAVELGGPSDGGVGVWRAAPLSLGRARATQGVLPRMGFYQVHSICASPKQLKQHVLMMGLHRRK